MKRTRLFAFIFGLSTITACCISNAFALYIKGASDVGFEIRGATTYTVTYYYPSSSDNGTFTSRTVSNLASGANIISNVPNTSAINGYSLKGWYYPNNDASNVYNTSVGNSDTVTSNISVYAMYTCANTMHYWDGSYQRYINTTTTDISVGASSVEIGERILGYGTGSGNVTLSNVFYGGTYTTTNILTSSGTYKVTRNGTTDWTILRKIGVKVICSWWYNDNAVTKVYCSNSSRSLSGYTTAAFSTSWGGTMYVDYSYRNFLYQRYSSDGNTKYNDAGKTITLSAFNNYSSSKIYAMINADNSNMAWVDANANAMPY